MGDFLLEEVPFSGGITNHADGLRFRQRSGSTKWEPEEHVMGRWLDMAEQGKFCGIVGNKELTYQEKVHRIRKLLGRVAA